MTKVIFSLFHGEKLDIKKNTSDDSKTSKIKYISMYVTEPNFSWLKSYNSQWPHSRLFFPKHGFGNSETLYFIGKQLQEFKPLIKLF